MEKKICSQCGELVSDASLTHCPYCNSLFISVEDVKDEMLSDDDMYGSAIDNDYERYYS